MASARKEYKMLMTLSAKLGSNFAGTFASAQKTVSETRNKIRELSKQQSDISAYQKQQESITKTNQKLESYERQLENVRADIKNAGNATSDLKNKEEQLKYKIDNTKDSIAKKSEKLQQLRQRMKDAGTDTNNLAKESDRLEKEIKELKDAEDKARSETIALKEAERQAAKEAKELEEAQKKASEEAKNFGDSTASAAEIAANALEAAGLTAALSSVYNAFKECVTIAAEFQSTMSTVEALSGADYGEMSALSDMAKNIGATTAFTANQAAEAMTYMGMAGWDSSQMLSGMDGVINLAAASGEDLAAVSDIVTDSLTAFGLAAEDSAHFSDVLAKTATSSNTNVALMGETFKYVAPLAGAMGYSIEDMGTAVGIMANAGIKGSMAGTALKNIISRLASPTDEVEGAMERLGVSLSNADGSAKPFRQVLDELRTGFSNITSEADKAGEASAIAGKYGLSGLLALVNSTQEDFDKLYGSLNDCTGAAQEMAKIKLDNLAGDVTLLESAADGLKNTVGSLYEDELRSLAQAGADILTNINEFIEKNPTFTKILMNATALVGGFVAACKGLSILKTLGSAFSAFSGAQTALTAVGGIGSLVSGIGPVVAIVGTLAAGVAAVAGILSTMEEDSVPTVEELTTVTSEAAEAARAAEESFANTKDEVNVTAQTAQAYITRLEEIEAATDGNVAENEEYHAVLGALCDAVPELAEYIDLETNSIVGGTEALRDQTEAWRLNAEEQAKQNYLKDLYKQYGDVIAELEKNKISLVEAETEENKILAEKQTAVAKMDKLYNEARIEADKLRAATGLQTEAENHLTQEYYDLQNSLANYNEEFYENQRLQENLNIAIGESTSVAETAKTAAENYAAAISQISDAAATSGDTVNNAAGMYEAFTTAASDALTGATETVWSVVKQYEEMRTSIEESVEGAFGSFEEAAEVVPQNVETINNALQSQIDYWNDYQKNLEEITERSEDFEGLQEIISTFADGSPDSAALIAGLNEATDDELQQMVDNFGGLQQAQEDAKESLIKFKDTSEEQLSTITDSISRMIEEDLALEEEAKAAAQKTITAYLDTIKKNLPYFAEKYGGEKSFEEFQEYQSNWVANNPNAAATARVSAWADSSKEKT